MLDKIGLSEKWQDLEAKDIKKAKKNTQKKIHTLIHLKGRPDGVQRTRVKLHNLRLLENDSIWKKDFTVKEWTPDGMAKAALHNLRRLGKLSNPRVVATAWGFAWNRWTTSHRMGNPTRCGMCGKEESKDHISHFPYCEINRRWAQRRLNEDPLMMGNMHMWSLTHPRLKNNDDLLQKLGIWIYVTHRCTNAQRWDKDPLTDTNEIHNAMDQWGMEAIRGTPPLVKIWNNAWNPSSPKENKDNRHAKKSRNQKMHNHIDKRKLFPSHSNKADKCKGDCKTSKQRDKAVGKSGNPTRKRTAQKSEGQRKFLRPSDDDEALLKVRPENC